MDKNKLVASINVHPHPITNFEIYKNGDDYEVVLNNVEFNKIEGSFFSQKN